MSEKQTSDEDAGQEAAQEEDAGQEGTVPEASQDQGAGQEVSEEERREIEEERKERLDPENRPDNAEVDNTDRDFDTTTGQFTDTPDDPDLGPFEDPEKEEG